MGYPRALSLQCVYQIDTVCFLSWPRSWALYFSLIALRLSDWYSLLSQLTKVLGIALPVTTSTWFRKLNTRVSLSKRYLQAAQQRETKIILYFLLDGRQTMCYRRRLTCRPVLWRIPTMPGRELVSWLVTILFGRKDEGIFKKKSLVKSLCGHLRENSHSGPEIFFSHQQQP